MPPRPSRNLDRALLAAGRELLPERGCAGLSVREVADAAGVNLGMFHYHFKIARGVPARADAAGLRGDVRAAHAASVARTREPDAKPARRAARAWGASCATTGRFLARVLADALCGEPMRARIPARQPAAPPRACCSARSPQAQQEGAPRRCRVPQVIGLCAGSAGDADPVRRRGGRQRRAARPRMARRSTAALLSDAAHRPAHRARPGGARAGHRQPARESAHRRREARHENAR